jgi:hypothetical protein
MLLLGFLAITVMGLCGTTSPGKLGLFDESFG